MNEMNASEAILETVVSEARRTGARIVSMKVAVGSMSGCHIPSMRTWLVELSNGTPAEGCHIEMLNEEPLARCLGCGGVFSPDSDGPLCSCGSVSFSLVSGQEAYLESFILEYPEAAALADEPPPGFGKLHPEGSSFDVTPVDG
jgi:Zn finger protein HypA/HybF involved in hydrogenase expression